MGRSSMRLGDVYRFGMNPFNREQDTALYLATLRDHPQSIAADYLREASSLRWKQRDEKAITRVALRHCPRKLIGANDPGHVNGGDSRVLQERIDVVVHVRLGDVIQTDAEGKAVHRKYNTGLPLAFYQSLAKRLSLQGDKHVMLLSGIHKASEAQRKASREFLEEIVKTFKDEGLSVVALSNPDPDTDFCVMATSRKLVTCKSGFSDTAGAVVRKLGNTVIDWKSIKF